MNIKKKYMLILIFLIAFHFVEIPLLAAGDPNIIDKFDNREEGLRAFTKDTGLPVYHRNNDFEEGQCTWFAKAVRKDDLPIPDGQGNAKNWYRHCKNAGYAVDPNVPLEGSIIVTSESVYGHVSLVTEIKGDHFIVWDSNYKLDKKIRKRKVYNNNPKIIGFIYWKNGQSVNPYTKFEFEGVTPDVNAVHPKSEITFTFNKPLDPSSVERGVEVSSFHNYISSNITVTKDVLGNELKIKSKWIPGTRYKIKIKNNMATGALTSIDKQVLSREIDYSFLISPNIEIPGTATAMVIDTSGSMNSHDPNSGMSKLNAARESAYGMTEIARNETEVYGANHYFGIISFSNSAQTDGILDNNFDKVTQRIQILNAGGGTNIGEGLVQAINMLKEFEFKDESKKTGKKIIILLSDGLTNQGLSREQIMDPNGEILTRCQDTDKGTITIYTIGFGIPGGKGRNNSLNDYRDEELLNNLAYLTGGKSYTAKNYLDLQNIFISIRHESTGEIVAKMDGIVNEGATRNIGHLDVKSSGLEFLATLNWPGSKMEIVLKDPVGVMVGNDYPGVTINNNVRPATAILRNPRQGKWEVFIRGVEAPPAGCPCQVIISQRRIDTIFGGVPTIHSNDNDSSFIVTASSLILLLLLVMGLIGARKRRHRKLHQSRRAYCRKLDKYLHPPGTDVAIPIAGYLISNDGRYKLPINMEHISIGRSPGNIWRFDDPKVSAFHAICQLENGKIYIQDLNSTNGVYVNGHKISKIKLEDGNVIQIGNMKFRYKEYDRKSK